uniref:Regulator of telomere elongation helicase 1 n=1 Tax=Cyprinus carpio TaxID=7962 RepID=A0A8C1WPH9_CYPCA
MPLIKLRGVSVDFPFTPYPCQEDYMNKVIECLQNKVNGVLESPTGTGKTLCLLCSALGWREHFKDTISARKIAERMGGAELFPDRAMSSWGTAATDGDTPTYYTDIPKIIYASRTHSQLTQVISELKNTSYRPKICVLGSREQLCINQEVMRHESNHIKVHMCRAKVSSRTCVFYNNVDEKSTDKEIMNSILDVEDLVKTGKKQRVCPYYLSRTLKQHADVIFMPYNYLLDPKSRRAHNIELKGAVVIFDEAHNVEKMCEESTSFDLTPYDLISAIEAVDRLLREQASDISKADSAEDFNVESIKKNIFLNAQLINLTEVLMDLESSINGFEMPANNQGITKPGSFIYELFQTAHVNSETKTAVVEAMEQITGYLAGRPGVFLNTSGLQKVADIIQVRIIVFHFQSLLLLPESVSHQVHIHPDTSNFKKKQVTDVWASSSTKKQGNVLSYWCFSPGFSMQELLRQEVRSIILTSGTLSPLSSFTCEMQIPFPVSLENPHVIQRDQIFVSVIEKGPDGVQLSTAFNRRFVPENMSSMGNTLVNLARVVPHGLLVFFPSYPVMDKTLEFWRVIDGYYDKVNDPNSNGGSFFAVCRGKASEGLDFADTYGRGVVITGLPFPPRMDPRVVLKMQYLDEMCKNKISGVKVPYLSGQEWYRQQASRAVNQAIGRVIRHREDYGAIFLCDHRFKGTEARNQLPSWVRPYVKIYDGFGTMVRDAAQFFRTAQKTVSPFLACKNQAVTGPLHTGSSCSAKSVWLSDTSQKAKTLDSHVPSLKRRKLGELTSIPAFFWPFNEASRLSTLSLQHDKRLDDESRGGKRKIKVVQERKTVASCTAKTGKAFMMELRRCLSHENFKLIMEALQSYKTSDDLSDLLANVTEPLIQDHNTHCLLRGLYQFIRPHHKKEFDERCLELTGEGCGYKQEHSLSREERDQLNQGGSHLLSGICTFGTCFTVNVRSEVQKPQTSIKEGLSCSSLLSDIKLAIGAEKTKQMFLALQAYKTSNNYEQMVSTVVSLLTERDEDIALLEPSPLSAGKTQSKISSFFS